MQNSTKTLLLLAILLLVIFPFAGLAPLLLLMVVGLMGMILQLFSTALTGAEDE